MDNLPHNNLPAHEAIIKEAVMVAFKKKPRKSSPEFDSTRELGVVMESIESKIDIIAEDRKGVLCFVEVKARSRDDFGLPAEAVTHYKQKRLLAAAYIYLEKNNIKARDMRFDVVSVDLVDGKTEIIKNAFDVDYD